MNKDLSQIVADKIQEIKSSNIKVDCYSYRREGRPSDKATEDCDYAIDVYSDDDQINFGQKSIEKDPYSNGSNLMRLKFKH